MTALVRCDTCGKDRNVHIGRCLSRGWPICHGKTMRLVPRTYALTDFEQATKELLARVTVLGKEADK